MPVVSRDHVTCAGMEALYLTDFEIPAPSFPLRRLPIHRFTD